MPELCNAAQVSREWRGVIYEQGEAGFQTCFLRDFGVDAAAALADRKTWRDKYM